MSRFDDRFENHVIHAHLENVLTILNTFSEERESSETIVEMERIKQVISAIVDMLSNCDPNLVSIAHLDTISTYLNNAYVQLSNYSSTRNLTHLQTANSQLDNLLPNLSMILRPISPQEIKGVKKAIVSFRESVTNNLKHAEEDFKKIEDVRIQLEEGLNQVSSTVEIQKSRLDIAIAEFQQQFSQAEDSRRKLFDNFLGNSSVENAKNDSERESDYEKAEKLRKEDFESARAKNEQIINDLFLQFENSSNELKNEFLGKAENYINILSDYKKQAAQSLNMISISSMAGGYKTVADKESSSLKLWRIITMIAMILLVVASVISFIYPFGDKVIVSEIARRVFVAGAFATIAGYSSRQAKIHLVAERRYRKMELELTALNPYLAELEDVKRQEILEKMTVIFFGRDDTEKDQKESNESNKEVNGKLSELGKLLDFAKELYTK